MDLLDAMDREVTVVDMMAARDKRAVRQRALLDAQGVPVVCLTLNIAGPVKVTRVIVDGFDEAVRRIREQFARYGLAVRAAERVEAATGLEMLWAVDAEPPRLKRMLCQVEEADRFGRLLDIDVIARNSEKVSRQDIGLPPRRCLLCGEDAAVCARSRAHTVEALFGEAEAIFRETLDAAYADRIATLAQRALLHEAACSPKPGLVDRFGPGAHKDMDFWTFVDSASVLAPYFRDCVRVGMRETTPERVFSALRYPGMRAETAMLAVTGGVNTHKGAIFSLGILCSAVGHWRARGEKRGAVCGENGENARESDGAGPLDLDRNGDAARASGSDGGAEPKAVDGAGSSDQRDSGDAVRILGLRDDAKPKAADCAASSNPRHDGYSARNPAQPDTLCALCGAMTRDALAGEIAAIGGPVGARGEVAAGFPSVRETGLPALKERLAMGENLNDAGVYALIALMACVEDANVYRRGGADAARRVREAAEGLLAGFSLDRVRAFADQLAGEGLSPGGCADLLAVTYFLWFFEGAA